MEYKIKSEKFEGPLDLLLQLIEKEKMSVTEISLFKVTDDYLSYLEKAKNIELTYLADFLHIAAQLILIKSRSLLPSLEIDDDETLSAEELQRRLLEYKKFKDLSLKIESLFKNKNKCFEQRFFAGKIDVFYPGKNLNMKNIEMIVKGLLFEVERLKKFETRMIKETVSIKEKISHIRSLISKKINIKFYDILKNSKTKTESIVSFLAMLELVKQKIVKVEQLEVFGDIDITNLTVNR